MDRLVVMCLYTVMLAGHASIGVTSAESDVEAPCL